MMIIIIKSTVILTDHGFNDRIAEEIIIKISFSRSACRVYLG